MPSTLNGPVKPARGTQSALDALAQAGALVPFAIYYTTDTRRLCLAATTTTYTAWVRADDLGPQNRVVTQAQYDALSTTDQNNPNIVYLIKE